ncbi:hypothetical protein ERD32_02455 [Lactobacillus crispatus]|jgi:hypothetical protein|uniref:Uncharacterized protein n=1 Tax=Lactobacillus crispatus TaxID=47770 RepID=A0A4Q0LVK9_9LACO|nr:hypothetical protein [Lactobacillus crispatus]CPR93022.1 Uncharacterised protein [Chlamydia trachomatis]DAP43925.1 MAG TPA: putative coiled-coil domain-containing protein [Caudoviricetes sp.]KWU05970.1 hypothetical protein AEL96_06215 [Lactobacillus crispatus]MBG0732073.1 hypothetical protein [Lactobacillus crispatus]MBI1706475.1 hypothetical protein [Lactobacillus crispatus]
MNTLEQYVANELGTIIANQSIKIAKLEKENQSLRLRNAQLQEIRGKKVKSSEPKTDNIKNR